MGSYTFAYLLYALGQASLAVWAFRLLKQDRSAAAMTLMLPPAAVVYDNLMIALGSYIGPGPLLQALTIPRFAGHALITPIWIVTAVLLALRAGAFQRTAKGLTLAAWILYGSMVVIGLLNEVVFYAGELVTEGDVLYYTNVGRLFTPPPPSLTMLLVVLLCGAVVLWRTRWPWMLLGSIPVLLSQALRTESAAFVFINSGEVIMSASLVLTLVFLRKREARARLEG
ncbi:MAG: hypothetical protein AB7T74_14695 [Clostridia bacterium]